jgi:hypothetical protein
MIPDAAGNPVTSMDGVNQVFAHLIAAITPPANVPRSTGAVASSFVAVLVIYQHLCQDRKYIRADVRVFVSPDVTELAVL